MEPTFPHLRTFCFELVSEVLNHCQPKELYVVALTNSDYKIEAERVLYRSIALNNWAANSSFKISDCLSTLAKIQSKADMVEFFELISLDSVCQEISHIDVQERLSASLVAMRSLKHLKLNFTNYEHRRDVLRPLFPALKSCTFSLTTLHIPLVLLDDWILSQNQLEVFQMHGGIDLTPEDRQLSICKQLLVQNSSRPTIFLIGPFGSQIIDTIVAFPIFSANTRWSAKDVADSLVWATPRRLTSPTRIQTIRPKADEIIYFELILDSLSDEGTVDNILTSLAEHFHHLKSIIFVINDSQIHLVCRWSLITPEYLADTLMLLYGA